MTAPLTPEEIEILGLDEEPVSDDQMEQLASKLMQEALAENASIETRLDVFKAVAAYRLGLKKHEPKKADKNVPGPFAQARERINAVKQERQ